MKKVKSVLLTMFFTMVFASMTTIIVRAANYYYSEGSLYWISGPSASPTTYSSSGCAGGSCRYKTQSSDPSTFRWSYSPSNLLYYYAYCPTIGQAAANYGARFDGSGWAFTNVVMNQANSSNQGKYVYLGYTDWTPNSGGYLMTSNRCVSGYSCSGLKVFWDNILYVTQ